MRTIPRLGALSLLIVVALVLSPTWAAMGAARVPGAAPPTLHRDGVGTVATLSSAHRVTTSPPPSVFLPVPLEHGSALPEGQHGALPGCKAVTQSGSVLITVNASKRCAWTNTTLGGFVTPGIVVLDPLTLSGGGIVDVEAGITVDLYYPLVVTDGVVLVFGGGDVLVLEKPTSELEILSGSSVLLNRSTVNVQQGEIYVYRGTVIGNANATTLKGAVVKDLNVTGAVGTGQGGIINISSSSVQWLNVTHGTFAVSLSGLYGSAAPIDRFNSGNATLTSFDADDVALGNISLGSVENLTLGNPYTTASDSVAVYDLYVSAVVNYTITLAHTSMQTLRWGGARSANIVDSTFASSSNGITDVSSSFVATSGSIFLFPMEFNGTASVRLVNVTATQLELNGMTRAVLYNWPGFTYVSGSGVANLASVSVNNESAYAQVFRYLTVNVQGVGGTLPPVSTVVSFTMISVPGSKPIGFALPSNSSVLAIYLPTDNVSAGGDTFTGDYHIVASAPGLSAATSLNVVSDNLRTSPLVLSSDVAPTPFSFLYLVAESAALVAVVGGSAYLLLENRRQRLRKGASPSKDEEQIEVPT